MNKVEKNIIPQNNTFTVEVEKEEDGRFIAEVIEIPGVMVYGKTRKQAILKAQALAFRVMADYIESGKIKTKSSSLSFSFA